MTCAGAAQTNKVESISQNALRPKSCASAPSPIHGMGVFAQQDLVAGTEIPYNRSIGVNGINHSCRPNVVSRDTGSAVLRVTRPIAKGDEIVIDYLQWADRLVFGKCNCGYCAEVSRG